MQRSDFLRQGAIVSAVLALSPKDLMARLLQQPAGKIKMLRDNFGIYTEQGGTIAFLLSKTGIVVVDSQFPEPAKHLIAELKQRSNQPIYKLINTHHHGDHTGGNISFKGLAEHVVAHANSKYNQENVAKAQKKEDQQLYPDQTYSNTWSEKLDRERFTLNYFGAGHTNGDSLVHFEHAGIVHMGDLVFNRRHPFVDRSAGANMQNWITVLDKALETYSKKTTFIFGHAGEGYEVTGTKADLIAFRDYLGNTLKYVDSQIKAGKNKDEILKTTGIPGSPEWKGDGIARPLGAAYDELTPL
ncbi:MAG: MBL fold metallo-hydrolase [Bacteroidetes bacterium]|nr:MBL fold metallo-hydrolase [Bacteroidota bacterium]